MSNTDLIKFIKEARKRGFDDYEIRDPLIKKGWPLEDIESAFSSLKPIAKYKNRITIFIDSEILSALEKRAKKNLFTLNEQMEDILRRSAINLKKSSKETEKLDDMLVGLFSRKQRKK